MTNPAKTTEAQLRQATENIIPDLETELGMLQAQLRQEREAHNLTSQLWKADIIRLQAQVAKLQATVGQQAKDIESIGKDRDEAIKQFREQYSEFSRESAQKLMALREALEIACGSGKFANPKSASVRILAAVEARAALATCPAPAKEPLQRGTPPPLTESALVDDADIQRPKEPK